MEGNSIRTFQNLCKIFEMRIRLDNAKGESTSEEVIDNYEKYAQKIDSYYNEKFQNELKDLISPGETLEKEKDRLERLINLLEDRLEKRSTLAGDFHRTTGKYIKNLQLIVSESELNNKKERLNLITKYLDTTKEIEDIKENVKKLKESLDEENVKKEEYLEKNKILEDELYSTFVTSVSSDEYYSSIEEENILDILSEVSKKAQDTKETLDITKESVASLLSSGMNDEYESYIEEASKSYSLWKDREIVLKIYKLVINFEDEFADILSKRETINNLFEERKTIDINSDILLPFENVMLEQSKILNTEKEILDNISNYTSRIDFKEDRLSELEEVIKEPEILAILNEYNVDNAFDTSDEDNNIDVSFELPDDFKDNEDSIVNKEYNPFEIVSVEDCPSTLNVQLAKLKGSSVREKVNKKLNPEDAGIPEFAFGVIPDGDINNNLNNSQIAIDNMSSDDDNNVKEEDNTILDEQDNNTVEVKKEDDLDNKSPELETSDNEEKDNSFWIPVSDSKLETGAFPNINIPITNDSLNNSEDNFGFPESDN